MQNYPEKCARNCSKTSSLSSFKQTDWLHRFAPLPLQTLFPAGCAQPTASSNWACAYEKLRPSLAPSDAASNTLQSTITANLLRTPTSFSPAAPTCVKRTAHTRHATIFIRATFKKMCRQEPHSPSFNCNGDDAQKSVGHLGVDLQRRDPCKGVLVHHRLEAVVGGHRGQRALLAKFWLPWCCSSTASGPRCRGVRFVATTPSSKGQLPNFSLRTEKRLIGNTWSVAKRSNCKLTKGSS